MKYRSAVVPALKDNGHVNNLNLLNNFYWHFFIKLTKEWFNRDLPSGNGDCEEYGAIVTENPSFNCPNPTYVAARTSSTKVNSL